MDVVCRGWWVGVTGKQGEEEDNYWDDGMM